MKHCPGSFSFAVAPFTLVLALLAPGVARADVPYKIQPIARLGDNVGSLQIRADGDFEIGTLNDSGQIDFVTENAAGGEMLLQYADGKLTPIVVGGQDAPTGKWAPENEDISSPVSMDQAGNIVFATLVTIGDDTNRGTFLWDYKAQKVTAIALPGMAAVNGLTFERGGDYTPILNNRGEIALVARTVNAAGDPQDGVFFRGADSKLRAVALPDQDLPGGGQVLRAKYPSLNEAGLIAFLARRQSDDQYSAYMWENGTITPLAVVGQDAPGGGKFAAVWAARVNNKNRSVLLDARVDDPNGPDVLYLYAGGTITPVAVPGQEMPGGGKFQMIPLASDAPTTPIGLYGISYPNDAGQYAFLALLDDGATAAYRVEADGKPSLILKSGSTTSMGTITTVGEGYFPGLGLNSSGQVAVTVKFGDGPATVVLLTPTKP